MNILLFRQTRVLADKIALTVFEDVSVRLSRLSSRTIRSMIFLIKVARRLSAPESCFALR